MKKHKKIKLLVLAIILFIAFTPFFSQAEGTSCPTAEWYAGEYFNLSAGTGSVWDRTYTRSGDVLTYSIKKAYLSYVKVNVNDDDVTPDENGNLTIDIGSYSSGDVIIVFDFTVAPNSGYASDCTGQIQQSFTTMGGTIDFNASEIAEANKALSDLDNDNEDPINSDFDDTTAGHIIKITDPTKLKFLAKDGNQLLCSSDKNAGKTSKHYSYTADVNTNSSWCKVTCREDVIVTLDEPVITQSGMCFSYVVDIKTKSVCKGSFLKPKPVLHAGCTAGSACSGGTDKGGPSEEFDSCINSCDGGEYTQSCINKCYTKVYEKDTSATTKSTSGNKKTTTKKTSTETKDDGVTYLNNLKASNSFVEPSKMASGKKIDLGSGLKVRCYTDEELYNMPLTAENIQAVYDSKKYLPGGTYLYGGWTPTNYYYYIAEDGTKSWINKKGGCPSNISYHYFTSYAKTATTISELNGTYVFPRTGRIHIYRPFGGTGAIRREAICSGGSCFGSVCGESCYTQSTCQGIVNGYVVTGKNVNGETKTAFSDKNIVTKEQALRNFYSEIKVWKRQKKACKAKANTCREQNSSYVIKTDETSKNTGKNLGKTYNSKQHVTPNESSANKNKNEGDFPSMIINTNGLCVTGECANNQLYCNTLDKNSNEYKAYCQDKSSCKNAQIPACKNGNTCFDYHTTLSFPKTYLNIKTGAAVTKVEPTKLPYYVAVGNAYCTSLTAKDVNTKWYDYKLDSNSTVLNYGIFNWSFDFSCFYAIKNPMTDTCDDKDNCTSKIKNNCTGSDCNNGNSNNNTNSNPLTTNAKVRSINLSNLFSDRKARFNWTNNAKNTSNPNYKVDPDTLVKAIESTGDKVFSDNKYRDYYVVLDKNAINQIRNYNKNKTYNDSSESATGGTVYGIPVYRSKFLDDLGKSVVKERGLIGCNNQTSGTTCNTEGGN